MLYKIFLFALLVSVTCAIQKRQASHLQSGENHKIFGLFEPDNPRGRSEKEVCEHYGGRMCSVFKVGEKCCAGGTIKDTYCGSIGCEHDTLSITDKDWNYDSKRQNDYYSKQDNKNNRGKKKGWEKNSKHSRNN